MHYYEVAPIQIIRPNSQTFTYSSETPLPIGAVVRIEVGKKPLIGIVIAKTSKPVYQTKPVLSIILDTPLPLPLIKTTLWMSDYYATHLALGLQLLLPKGLEKSRRHILTPAALPPIRDRTIIVLNKDQQRAIEAIDGQSGSTILHGVTGSGKTAVYIELAKRTLAKNRSVIVLVPEIALTSQLVDEFSQHFSNVIVTHSQQTEAERHHIWQRILTNAHPVVIVGPRSALFLPVASLGLIVVDESHEPSFKQEQSPRYSALRVASIIGAQHKASVVFGSATPSITEYYTATQTNQPITHLAQKARHDTTPPTVELIDITKRQHFRRHTFLSDSLLTRLTDTVAHGYQALLFHNRRGHATTTLCKACGWSPTCISCFLPYTLHADEHLLRCHICGMTERIPTHCPMCNAVDIIYRGFGTKRLEDELQFLFPNKKVVRFDGDVSSDNTLAKRYDELYSGTADIIIGTQVVAKGLDLPHLRTVGVVQADTGLALPDFSSAERTFQLLAQVVGRVGRSHHPTSVIVQTYHPTHPAITFGLTQDYSSFYSAELIKRKAGHFPPFTFLLKLICTYKTEAATVKNTQGFARQLRTTLPTSVHILGPTPAFYERQAGNYRWQIVVKAPSRAPLLAIVRQLPSAHWQFELDPISLL